jgi:glycosyltransferase involved in cell wall biosynthesis
MARLSVTIIARDEERDLPGCLESVRFADEVVVVDSGSRDRTRDIARAAGAKVYENPWPGYGAQKELARQKATGDWVLNLDADERCSPQLAAALPGAFSQEDVDAFSLPFPTWVFGRRARFGELWGERHVRLFRRERARYAERAVHETVLVEGRVARLDAPVYHLTYASLEEYLDKVNRYTSALARERYRQGRRFSPLAAVRLPWGFFRRYVLRLGLLDGWAGFLLASVGALYDLLKYAKLDDCAREAGVFPRALP